MLSGSFFPPFLLAASLFISLNTPLHAEDKEQALIFYPGISKVPPAFEVFQKHK